MPTRDPRAQLSKDVFGRSHAISIAETFVRLESTYLDLDELERRSGAPRTTVFKEVELLTEIGALTKNQAVRNVYLANPKHGYWRLIESLLESTARGEENWTRSLPDT